MVNLTRFGKRDCARYLSGGRDRRGRNLIAGVAMALLAAHPALAEAKPKADAKTRKLRGCWAISGEMSCSSHSSGAAPWSGTLCFSRHGKAYNMRYNGCEGEGLGYDFDFKARHDRITFISTTHARRVTKSYSKCQISTVSSTEIAFSCAEQPNPFDGAWTKLCSRVNAAGSGCADKHEILPRKGWEAGVEYLPEARRMFLP
jgi:uncharacterized membrane protein